MGTEEKRQIVDNLKNKALGVTFNYRFVQIRARTGGKLFDKWPEENFFLMK